MRKPIAECIFFLCLVFIPPVFAGDDPDELYRQERFAEAEKGYSLQDMDNPKDISHRYNRGCAAYMNSDYKGASAAFSSVSKRTKSKDILFRTAYNSGNSAFKQGDFKTASTQYKKAVILNPESKDARYNLELALREEEKIKKEKDKQAQKDSENLNNDKSQSGEGEKGQNKDKESGKKDQGNQDKEGQGQDKNADPSPEKSDMQKKGQEAKEDTLVISIRSLKA